MFVYGCVGSRSGAPDTPPVRSRCLRPGVLGHGHHDPSARPLTHPPRSVPLAQAGRVGALGFVSSLPGMPEIMPWAPPAGHPCGGAPAAEARSTACIQPKAGKDRRGETIETRLNLFDSELMTQFLKRFMGRVGDCGGIRPVEDPEGAGQGPGQPDQRSRVLHRHAHQGTRWPRARPSTRSLPAATARTAGPASRTSRWRRSRERATPCARGHQAHQPIPRRPRRSRRPPSLLPSRHAPAPTAPRRADRCRPCPDDGARRDTFIAPAQPVRRAQPHRWKSRRARPDPTMRRVAAI
jgi:hypothetical protein